MAIEAHRVDPELHRVLSEQIPRTERLENVETANRQAQALFKAYLESRRDEIAVTDLDLAVFICATSIEALAHNAVLHHAALASDAAAEVLIDETTRLILGYLQPVPRTRR
jgi:hypothetical protein